MDHNVPISFLCVPIHKTVKAIFKVRNGRNSHKVMVAYSLTYLQDSAILQRLISKLAVHDNQALMLSCIRLFNSYTVLTGLTFKIYSVYDLLFHYTDIKKCSPLQYFLQHQYNKQQCSVLSEMCSTFNVFHFSRKGKHSLNAFNVAFHILYMHST